VIEAEEQGFVEKLVPHPALKLSQKPFCIGLPGAMKCQSILFFSDQASMALQVSPRHRAPAQAQVSDAPRRHLFLRSPPCEAPKPSDQAG
jgi:hypothetical protein